MFIEPNLSGGRRGWIEVICGSMFSGKTEELIRRLKRAKIANLKVEIFKPAKDTRYDRQNIVSHDEKLAMADYITKLHAICVKCGNIASYSFRKAEWEGQIQLGETDNYGSRCRTCYYEKDQSLI